MDAVNSSSDQAADLLQKLSLDSENKAVEVPEATNEAIYGENGSLTYQQNYGAVPYGAYASPASSVPAIGNDGQVLGLQEYHYPSPYYQSSTQNIRPSGPNQAGAPLVEAPVSLAADQASLSVEGTKGKPNVVLNGGSVSGNKGPNQPRPVYQNSSLNANSSYRRGGYQTGVPSPTYQDPRMSFDGSHLASGRNNNLHLFPHFLNASHARPASGLGQSYAYMNHMYPSHGMYGHYGNMISAGSGFGSYAYDSSWKNGQGWGADNKYKNRSRGYGVIGYGKENMDGLNELNRGPRAKGFRNQEGVGPVALTAKEQKFPASETFKENNMPLLDTQQYNREDFPGDYLNAKFFVIKSYSEDDIHKSIKYNVWSSTPNGNKKLDAAYHEAKEKPDGCPVFLFFSVNTSGQFVGIAEMVGPVDFNKTVEYWQQDKWIGCFPVKWHLIKDVPNNLLRHITLENNENKPVTNSRDTQEVNFEKGIQVIKIFKDHSSKTSILDDFEFYEDRQKKIQEKKAKQQHLKTQVLDGKTDNSVEKNDRIKDTSLGKESLQKSLDGTPQKELVGETPAKVIEANGKPRLLEQNGVSTKDVEETTEGAVNVVLSEKKVTSNGVASGVASAC